MKKKQKFDYRYLIIALGLITVLFLLSQKGSVSETSFKSSSELSTESMQRFSIDEMAREPETINLELKVSEFEKSYLSGKKTKSYAYNEMIPGPIIRAKVGDTIKVKVINDLDEETTVHWHGLQIKNSEDGVPGITQEPIMPGETFAYELEMKNSGTYWYHPHVSTHEQVEKGLYGALIVEDDLKEKISYDKDYILMLDDIRLDANNQITVPWTGHMDAAHGRFGRDILINGEVNPSFEVNKNSIVRLRLINTANARIFNFGLKGKEFFVVGEDIGLVHDPYLADYITISPGERFDILVHLEDLAEYQLVDYNSKGYNLLGSLKTSSISKEVTKEKFGYQLSGSLLNNEIPNLDYLLEQEADYTLKLEGKNTPKGVRWMINDKTFPEDPENLDLEEGKVYKIKLVNTQNQIHPMHLHGQKFLVLTRDGEKIEQNAWKDTVLIYARETVEIGFIAEGKGTWVNHCHILEHAELGMLSTVSIS